MHNDPPRSIESQEYHVLQSIDTHLRDIEYFLKHQPDPPPDPTLGKILRAIEAQTAVLQSIADELAAEPTTPSTVAFLETTMLDPVAGNTLQFTGTLSPAGSAFPAGTTFSVSSSDPNVTASVDDTGLVVTAVLGAGFAAGENDIITWATSTFTPSPAGSPASLTSDISITGSAAPTATPTGITFTQSA